MLYTLHGGNTSGNGCVVLPATNKEIIAYCIANPEIANKVTSHVIEASLNDIESEIEKHETTA